MAEADGSDGFGATVVAQAESKHGKRLNRSVILTVPVSLADGRRAFLEARLYDSIQ